jgi:hypothetical protein
MTNAALNERHVILRDGTPVLIRRLMAEDAALYPDFLSEVTAQDLRLRFFSSMREVSKDLVVVQFEIRRPANARDADRPPHTR